MIRRYAVLSVVLAGSAGALLFWPAVLVYTFTAGDTGTATIRSCDVFERRRGEQVVCHGSWRTDDGETGSGQVHGLHRDVTGRSVPVRVGPSGAYAGGFPAGVLLFAVPVLAAPLVVLGRSRLLFGPARATARSLLAGDAGGYVLVVARDAVEYAGGRLRLRVRAVEAPPERDRVQIADRPARPRPRTALEALMGLKRDAVTFSAVLTPSEDTVMVIEHRSSRHYEPEHVLLGASGRARALIRRLPSGDGESPSRLPLLEWLVPPLHRYTLVDAAGERLGSAEPIDGKRRTLRVKDAKGVTAATAAAATGRRWVLRVRDSAPPLLRDVCIALALSQYQED